MRNQKRRGGERLPPDAKEAGFAGPWKIHGHVVRPYTTPEGRYFYAVGLVGFRTFRDAASYAREVK